MDKFGSSKLGEFLSQTDRNKPSRVLTSYWHLQHSYFFILLALGVSPGRFFASLQPDSIWILLLLDEFFNLSSQSLQILLRNKKKDRKKVYNMSYRWCWST